ncbi:MAG: CapA family protein [Gemmatimonadota bacterium]
MDQVLPTPSDPRLRERWVKDAREYVKLAEAENGEIPAPVDWTYIWGHALDVLDREAPEVRIVNLETSVTTSDDPWPGKGIHYRMHPANVPCLTAAGVDCCVLANNHVLDWGREGLRETLGVLREARISTAGAGRSLAAASGPAILAPRSLRGSRVLVFGLGVATSGVPRDWAATDDRSGVRFVDRPNEETVRRLGADVERVRRPGDLVVVSIHWGPNWGYDIPGTHREFAHALIDEAGVDAIHGHSSHHPLGIEIYRHRPILYGCGDFLNDYEGIGGREEYRGELSLMYFPSFAPASRRLRALRLVPCRIERFRLRPASEAESAWLRRTLDRESRPLGARVVEAEDGTLEVREARV